jgi:hypothetical protein
MAHFQTVETREISGKGADQEAQKKSAAGRVRRASLVNGCSTNARHREKTLSA